MIKNSYCFCYIVLNAGAYLDYSLASITKLVQLNPKSGVVIVEGADQFSHALEKTEKGLSIDGTRDIIDKWTQRYPEKIMYYPMGHIKDKRELRNETLDLARNFFEVQYIFGVDGDELVKVEDFLKIDEAIDNHPNHCVFLLKHLMFWGDFWTKYIEGGYKESIFTNTHNLNYNHWHTNISLNNKALVSFMPSAILTLDNPFYHYGYIQNQNRLLMRRLYSYAQKQWFVKHIDTKAEWQGGIEMWQDFFIGQPYERKHYTELELFDKDWHPPEIKKHPWFDKTAADIWASNEMYPTFEYHETS